MKYTDRTKAKNKYKKMLLATAATLTLGLGPVSTFVGTTSAYAAGTTTKPKFTISDSSVKFLSDNNDALGSSASKLVGAALKGSQLKGNESLDLFANTARDMALVGVGMIPYVGAFISPIIGMVWPTSGPSQMEQLLNSVGPVIDEKISSYDIAKIKGKINLLQQQLKTFEDSVNEVPRTVEGSYYTSTIDNDNQILAGQIQEKFKDLIGDCSTAGYEEDELPLYTAVATAHILFLQYMKTNAVDHERIQMNEETLGRVYTDNMYSTAKGYAQHIQNISAKADKRFVEKLKNIKYAKEQIYVDGDTRATLYKRLDDSLVTRQDPLNKLLKDQFAPIFDAKESYEKTTKNSEAFSVAIKGLITEDFVKKTIKISKTNDGKDVTIDTTPLYKLTSEGFTTMKYKNGVAGAIQSGGVISTYSNCQPTDKIKIVVDIAGKQIVVYDDTVANIK